MQCTSDPSCFVISLMAIAKKVTLSTLPCGRQKILSGRPPPLRKTPGMTGSPQRKLEGFLLDPFHTCNLMFLLSIRCHKPSLGQRRLQRYASFSLNPFSIWHVSWVRASMVDGCFLKPDCSGQRMFFSRNHISQWFTILSNNLQMQLVSEIWR